MATRAQVSRKTARRGTVAVSERGIAAKRPVRPAGPSARRPGSHAAPDRHGSVKLTPFAPAKAPVAPVGGISSYARALRFLATLSHYERLRIVPYNTQTLGLGRMG